MWRPLSTKTSVSQCGMSADKTKFVRCGVIISKTHKVGLLTHIVTIEMVLKY